MSNRIVVQITSKPGETFLDGMIALVEGANRQKTPNEVALDILIAGITLIMLVAVVTLAAVKLGCCAHSEACVTAVRSGLG